MKRILSAVTAVLAVMLLLSGCTSASGDENYEYSGFITELYQNAKGDTVIVCLSDDVISEYIIKSSTKIVSAPADEPFAVGDHVMLSTTSRSDDVVEKIKVSLGQSNVGRLIYVESDSTPFLLTDINGDGKLLIKLIDERGTLPGVSGIGDVIKVYHSEHIVHDDPVVEVEAMTFVENGTAADLTDEDIAFIASKGYTVVAE